MAQTQSVEKIEARIVKMLRGGGVSCAYMYEHLPPLRSFIASSLSTKQRNDAAMRSLIIQHERRPTVIQTNVARQSLAADTDLEWIIKNIPDLREKAAQQALKKLDGMKFTEETKAENSLMLSIIRYCREQRQQALLQLSAMTTIYVPLLVTAIMWSDDLAQCNTFARGITKNATQIITENEGYYREKGKALAGWAVYWLKSLKNDSDLVEAFRSCMPGTEGAIKWYVEHYS